MLIDEYEEARPPRKQLPQLVLTRQDREEILVEWGASYHDVRRSMVTVTARVYSIFATDATLIFRSSTPFELMSRLRINEEGLFHLLIDMIGLKNTWYVCRTLAAV